MKKNSRKFFKKILNDNQHRTLTVLLIILFLLLVVAVYLIRINLALSNGIQRMQEYSKVDQRLFINANSANSKI